MHREKFPPYEPCPCGSGKKYKFCCLNGRQQVSVSDPTLWSHPPGQPDAAPPAGGEWVEYVFVKDKGWTHESELKPGDQYRLKGGGWGTVEPERVIGTTQEHPFYVQGKGWTPVAEIRPGDMIRTDNGWVQVSKIEDTGRYETVYNLKVADYHTYFVGAQDWGFSAWAHNSYDALKTDAEFRTQAKKYADIINSNEKNWTWRDVGSKISDTRRAYIKRYAEEQGWTPKIAVDPNTKFADFSPVTIKEATLPKELWLKGDTAQFKHLNDLHFDGVQPVGTTWHHHQDSGRMQLVPFGIHNSTWHFGGRSTGMWADAPR